MGNDAPVTASEILANQRRYFAEASARLQHALESDLTDFWMRLAKLAGVDSGAAHHHNAPPRLASHARGSRNSPPKPKPTEDQPIMLTHAQVAQLTGAERTALFDKLAASMFRNQTEICDALGIASRRTLQNWRGDNSVPIMAVLAMQAIAAAPNQPSALLQDARQIAAHMEAIGRELAQLTELMASVVKRLPDPS